MTKVACALASWYNKPINIVAPAMLETSEGWINLFRRSIVNTLPPHGQNNNTPPIPNASGIYKITCTANNKIYIGSSINLRKRSYHHFYDLRRDSHSNPHLQRAWNKYGEQCFIFEAIELVLPISLTAREQYWLHQLNPFDPNGFNIALVAGAPMSGRKATPETIEKMRQGNLGKTKSPEERELIRQRLLGNANWRGRKHTPESIEKIRQSRIGNTYNRGRKHTTEARANMKGRPGNTYFLGRKHTPETLAKMSQSQMGNKNNLGKKASPESIEKRRQSRMSNPANLGRKQSAEEIEKRRQANTGKKRTPEQIERIRQTRWGKREEDE